jgi:hypothetical protein
MAIKRQDGMGSINIMVVSAAAMICLAALIYLAPSQISNGRGSYEQARAKISAGQPRQAILELLGPPDGIKDTVKSNRHIWGPEEDFWDDIPMGARLEVWSYEFSDGGLNLYFVNGGGKLDYVAFAPKGVVYEAK